MFNSAAIITCQPPFAVRDAVVAWDHPGDPETRCTKGAGRFVAGQQKTIDLMPYFRAGVLTPGTYCWAAANVEYLVGAQTYESRQAFEFQPYCVHPACFNIGLTLGHGVSLEWDDRHIPVQEQRFPPDVVPPDAYRPGEPVHDMAPGPPESAFMRWSTSALPSRSRRYAAVATLGDRAFFVCGSDVEIYEGTTGAWSAARLSLARDLLTAATAGTRALFAGGWIEDRRPVDVVDIYDGETNAWTTDRLSVPRGGFAATSVGGKILFAGGAVAGVNPGTVVPPSAVVDIYDSQTGTWATAALSQARGFLAAATLGTKAFFGGGFTGNAYSDVIDIFDSETGLWSTAKLSQARSNLAATTVGNSVLFAGGTIGGLIYSDVVDIYNGVDWRTAKLSEARAGLAATSLHDKALFAGGHSNSNVSDRVDIYESATMGGVWSSAKLAEARTGVRASTIGDKALFAGGETLREASSVMDIAEQKEFIWETMAPNWIRP